MPLEQEQQFFESNRATLLEKYEGQYVLIRGDVVIGAYPDAEQAYTEGLAKFGPTPFLVKQVLREEPVAFAPMLSVAPADGHP